MSDRPPEWSTVNVLERVVYAFRLVKVGRIIGLDASLWEAPMGLARRKR